MLEVPTIPEHEVIQGAIEWVNDQFLAAHTVCVMYTKYYRFNLN